MASSPEYEYERSQMRLTMWEPLTREQLDKMIADAESQMDRLVKKLWDGVKIAPEKWAQHPRGDQGGGFWVVAIVGKWCVYYNNIEEGFNGSTFQAWGEIDEYFCEQDHLHHCMNRLYRAINLL